MLRATDSYRISYTEARFVRRGSIRDVLLYKKGCNDVRDVTARPTENVCKQMEFVLSALLAENTGHTTWPFQTFVLSSLKWGHWHPVVLQILSKGYMAKNYVHHSSMM